MSRVPGKCSSDFLCLSGNNIISFCTFLLTVIIMFPALVGLVLCLFSCIINHLHFRSYSPMFGGRLTKHPNVWNSSVITKQPDSPVAAAQPNEPIFPLCFWSELCRADCWGTARHFSASMAANFETAPCSLKLMQGQFSGSKGLTRSRPCPFMIL